MTPEFPRVWILDPGNLTPYYSLALGGSLASIGLPVDFVTSRFSYDSELVVPPGIDVHHHYFPHGERWDRFGSFARKAYRALRYPLDHARLIRRLDRKEMPRPDIVHMQWSRLPLFDRRLIGALAKRNIRVVHTVHDVEPLYDSAADVSHLAKVYAGCDQLIVHTESNLRDLLERYPILDPSRVRVVPHGPLQADEMPEDATQESARRALGIPLDARVVANFGSIKRYKGIDLLVDAIPMVAQHDPKVFLLLAGRPATPSDEPDLSILRDRHLAHRADFKFIPSTDAWKYYLAADVMALPYRNITQSGVLLSSMAFGKPAIVTDVGGLPEVIQAGKTGWVIPAENPTALAVAIREAISNRDACARMGIKAQQEVMSVYSWSTIARQTKEVYRAALETPSRTTG